MRRCPDARTHRLARLHHGERGERQAGFGAKRGQVEILPDAGRPLGTMAASTAFTTAKLPRGLIRGQFHDSFEYYGANWTAQLPEKFRALHGYDIQPYAAALLARSPASVTTVDRDTLGRIKSDYRETLAQLHLDYLRAWVKWSHDRGYLVRNQSHGAPGNLLDLYANADIAETEIFGKFGSDGMTVQHENKYRTNLDPVKRLQLHFEKPQDRQVAQPSSCTTAWVWQWPHNCAPGGKPSRANQLR